MSLSIGRERSRSHRAAIRAARVECYLLERSRVTSAPPEEKLYHIFYQVTTQPETGLATVS